MSFKVGDVCEYINVTGEWSRFSGTECTVTAGLSEVYGLNSKCHRMAYKTRSAIDGEIYAVEPHQLRRKHLPLESDFTAGDWELCPWRPKQVSV